MGQLSNATSVLGCTKTNAHSLLALLLLTITSATTADVGGDYALALKLETAGTFTVAAQLGPAVSTDLLVDTGSSYVVLSPSTFKHLRKAESIQSVRKIRGSMADGKVVEANVYILPRLSLGPNCTLTDVDAVVLKGASRDILGLSALRRMGGITLEFGTQTLKHSKCTSI